MSRIRIGGILQRKHLCHIEIFADGAVRDLPGRVFNLLGRSRINVEFIAQCYSSRENTFQLTFCVDDRFRHESIGMLEKMKERMGITEVFSLRKPVGVLALFPHQHDPLVIGTVLSALGSQGVPVIATNTSISAISCLIPEESMGEAAKVLSDAFEFG